MWVREEKYDTDSVQTNVVMDNDKTVTAVFEEIVVPGSDDPGEQTSHTAGLVGFHMRLAPEATFPTGIDDSGTATVDTPYSAKQRSKMESFFHITRSHTDNYLDDEREGDNANCTDNKFF